MASIRDVAKTANVSASTVSRVLNGTAPVNEETKRRVQETLEAMHYVLPEREAKKGKLHVGIILPRGSASNASQHPTIFSIITSFVSTLEKANVQNTMQILDDEKFMEGSDLFASPRDGYLILGTSQPQEDWLFERLLRLQIPYIIVNRWVNLKHLNYVNIDDVATSMNAVHYLIQRGRGRIAFIGGNPDFRNTKLRLIGFRKAMQEKGLPMPEEYIVTGKYTEESGYESGMRLLSLDTPPDAGFFTSDTLAIGFQKACAALRVSLPDDFYMVGFGDIELARHVVPPLTTVQMPAEEMGEQAAFALVNAIQHPQVARTQILMRANLIKRKSCGE